MRASLVLPVPVLALVAACNSTPLEEFMDDHGYTAFQVPRAAHGPGTIVDFKDGFESIVASPDPPFSQCMVPDLVPQSHDAVAVLTREYTLERKNSIELDLGQILGENVNLGAAFSDNRVETVSIEFIEPFEKRIVRQSVLLFYTSLAPDDVCRTHFQDDENYVINAVLGAQKVRYTFKSERGTSLSLDAQILNEINIDPELSSEFEGEDSLTVDGPIWIGFRLWELDESPGVARQVLSLDAVSASAARGLATAEPPAEGFAMRAAP